MYYTEIDPRTGESVYVPKTPHEKAMQRALMQYRMPQNYDLVMEALKKAHREDLIGFDKHCLIHPRKMHRGFSQGKGFSSSKGKDTKPKGGAKPFGKSGSKEKQTQQKKKTIRNVHKKKS